MDESWIGEMDFRRKHWMSASIPLSLNQKQVNPRVSLFAATTSDGHVFLSMTQVNTESSVVCLFLTELVKELDKLDPGWKSNSVLLLGNVSTP